jgi:hypothetical protein
VFTYQWRDKVDGAVAALTKAFGAAPTQRVEPGDGTSYPDYTIYQWDGFCSTTWSTAPGRAARDFTQPSYATFSRNEVGEIRLTAEHGIAIGATVDAVRGPPRQGDPARQRRLDPLRLRPRALQGRPPVQYSMVVDTDGTSVTAVLYYFAAGS